MINSIQLNESLTKITHLVHEYFELNLLLFNNYYFGLIK